MKFSVIQQRIVGSSHLQLTLQTAEKTIEAIAFYVSDEYLQKTFGEIEIVYRLAINEFRNTRKPQLIIEEWLKTQ